jgi:DNA polymerase-1
MRKRILLIDTFNLIIRAFAAIPTSNDNGNHDGAIRGMLQSIKILIEQFKPSIVIFCWEGKNSSKKRKKIFSGYKENRAVKKSLQKQFQWEYPEQEQESLRTQVFRIKEYFDAMPFYELEVENCEADDVIAYISNYHFKESDKIIVSSDKDYFQLITDSVSVYRPIKKELVTKQTLLDAYKISPQNWIMAKCLVGDNSDEVSGIDQIGMKRAIKLFPFINEEVEYNLEYLFNYSKENLIETKKSITKYYERILEPKNKEILERNYKLMQLMSHQISSNGIEQIKKNILEHKVQFSNFKLRLLFMQDNYQVSNKTFLEWQQCLNPLAFQQKDVLNDF